MKKCAFTVCTYSYTGLARVLKKSFLLYHPEYDFYIVYIDRNSEEKDEILVDYILQRYMNETDIRDMQFKYDVTEYSTSVKAYVFRYFFEKEYGKVLYFDPDIKFYSRFNEVEENKYEAYVTPHKLTAASDNSIIGETSMLKYGLFNCGFIGFNSSKISNSFLTFWSNRLLNYSFNDPDNGIYTDQKWIDFIYLKMPEKVKIINNPGCNFAPWNMDERRVKNNDMHYYVTLNQNSKEYHKLIFMHFSGFNYKLLQELVISHNFRNFELYDDLKGILFDYGYSLSSEKSDEYMKEPYKYNFYTNGKVISKLNRRLYRAMKKKYINPFDHTDEFYCMMWKSNLVGQTRTDAKANNTQNIGNKKKIVLLMLRVFKTFLGVDKYIELLRALQKYSGYEEQIFLVKGIYNGYKNEH